MRSIGVSYYGVRNPAHVEQDLISIRQHGIDAVLHTYDEADLASYGPNPETGRHTMAEIVDLSRRHGLTTYLDPWAVGAVFGGEATSELAATHREWVQIDSAGRPMAAVCLNHPGFRAWLKHVWVEAAAAAKPDYLFWDEPHFAGSPSNPAEPFSCRCTHCLVRYRSAFGEEMPDSLADDRVWRFRSDSQIDFIDELSRYAKGKGVKNAVFLNAPGHRFSPFRSLDDWRSVAALPAVDEIGFDVYVEPAKRTPEGIRAAYVDVGRQLTGIAEHYGKTAHIWIKGYKLKQVEEWKITVAIDAAAEAGVHRIMMWSYLATAYASRVACENPVSAWRTALQAFQGVRNADGPQRHPTDVA